MYNLTLKSANYRYAIFLVSRIGEITDVFIFFKITSDIVLQNNTLTNTIDIVNIRWFHIIYDKKYKYMTGAVLECHFPSLPGSAVEVVHVEDVEVGGQAESHI